jgi:hypothetical protein
MNSSRIRFTMARQLFEAFPIAASDIKTPPLRAEAPLIFAKRLLSARPPEAVAFCAYLLPRREAVWWGVSCVRALQRRAPDVALQAAEAWVRDPDETTRLAALRIGAFANKRSSTTWLANAAAWSGGNINPGGPVPIPARPHLTAKAVNAALILAIAQRAASEQQPLQVAFAEAGIRFAEGGDARPIIAPTSSVRRA